MRSISLVGITFRSTCWPGAVAPLKRLAVLEETKRRPLMSVNVRCEPSEYRSTKLCAMPNPGCWLTALEVWACDARTGDDDFLDLLVRFRRPPGLFLRLRADRPGDH